VVKTVPPLRRRRRLHCRADALADQAGRARSHPETPCDHSVIWRCRAALPMPTARCSARPRS
jgi:hypothetical protein